MTCCKDLAQLAEALLHPVPSCVPRDIPHQDSSYLSQIPQHLFSATHAPMMGHSPNVIKRDLTPLLPPRLLSAFASLGLSFSIHQMLTSSLPWVSGVRVKGGGSRKDGELLG